uniref:Uncharacterized protein n=1 Tax=Brassica oleracea var. oleracea TaxID=109376 RepID=A0A0D3DXG5_BRAOL
MSRFRHKLHQLHQRICYHKRAITKPVSPRNNMPLPKINKRRFHLSPKHRISLDPKQTTPVNSPTIQIQPISPHNLHQTLSLRHVMPRHFLPRTTLSVRTLHFEHTFRPLADQTVHVSIGRSS